MPVTCEPFRQWVIEDHFPAGRPALEKVGVTFTPHVHAYEAMKIRILNGGHAVIAYPSALMDIQLVHEAMAHPLIAAFLHKVEVEEILPHVAPVPDTSIPDYLTLIESRFSNPEIADTTRRLCLDGSNRQPKFIVPSLRDNLAAGTVPKGLVLLSALWCRYCYGTTDSGVVVEPNDPNWTALQDRARRAKENPAEWLAMTEVYGDLAQNDLLAAEFATALEAVWRDGAEAVLRRFSRPDPQGPAARSTEAEPLPLAAHREAKRPGHPGATASVTPWYRARMPAPLPNGPGCRARRRTCQGGGPRVERAGVAPLAQCSAALL